MKKTININLSGRVFYIDDDAFARLRGYLDRLEKYFANQEGAQEIISDIESRIAELLSEKIAGLSAVVSMHMVEEVMAMMGQPEDFDSEDSEKEPERKSNYSSYAQPNSKRLFRDLESRVLGGVCGGLGAYLSIDPVWVRVIFALLIFVGLGTIVPIYIVLWIIVPPAVTTAQKLQMHGKNVTIDNIEKAIRKEYEDVKRQFGKVRGTNFYKKSERWWNKFNKRDRTTLIIVAVVGGAILLFNMFTFNFTHTELVHNSFTVPTFMNEVNFRIGHLPFFHFPGWVVIAMLFLLIGLLFRTAFKIILYIIGFAILTVFGIKILSFILGSAFIFW
ncbi:phage shock protein C (PspC) family protein [Saccharicrinis carchari]|uniref:Phage shock protein C (PspC) family protein n=1 Tax=Saccharicrinis carchari TaxID=1168039 RepID=A0A521BZK3_SACCC|nr:PspC domain-containing protein [Saccharicrinis carchari]SMO52607.1 phage shock protein C (PspC) family protein [Saccharicrinis carchari]